MFTLFPEGRRGCGRALIVQLIAAAIGIPLICGLVFVPLWAVTQLDLSIWWLILSTSLFLLIVLGGGIGALVLIVRRRARQLDAAFTPLGLKGSMYQMLFRQYQGAVEGRQASVYLYRGPAVEIDVSTSLQTRLGATDQHADTQFLARLMDRQPLSLTDPRLSDLTVFALDETWARALLAHPEVPDLLQRLVAFEGSFTRRQVLLRPGWLRLYLFGSRNLLDFGFAITPEQAEEWLDALLALVRIAEALPAPQVTDEESSAERVARSMRSRNPAVTLAITIGTVAMVVLCSLAIGLAAFWWATTQ